VHNANYEGQPAEIGPAIGLAICLCAFCNLRIKNVL